MSISLILFLLFVLPGIMANYFIQMFVSSFRHIETDIENMITGLILSFPVLALNLLIMKWSPLIHITLISMSSQTAKIETLMSSPLIMLKYFGLSVVSSFLVAVILSLYIEKCSLFPINIIRRFFGRGPLVVGTSIWSKIFDKPCAVEILMNGKKIRALNKTAFIGHPVGKELILESLGNVAEIDDKFHVFEQYARSIYLDLETRTTINVIPIKEYEKILDSILKIQKPTSSD